MGTQEEIQERINSRLTMPANILEGGFSQDIIGSVAYELANILDVNLNDLINQSFVKTASGDYLDLCGADYGITRREATASTVYLEITGMVGASVNTNIKATYNNLVWTVQEYKTIPAEGVVLVRAKCETYGTIGNVAPYTINEFVSSYSGLTSVTNPDAAYDGFDLEDDEIYRQRILDYLAEDSTNANAQQYHTWAMSVSGVQKAVIKSAETMGAGNVGVYIAAIDTTVSDDLIQEVKEYIESVQPINATVIVQALEYIDINIHAELTLQENYPLSAVIDEFTTRFKEYLLSTDVTVSYFYVNNLFFLCTGVEDVANMTMNNGTDSINITDIQIAVMGDLDVQKVEE